MFKQIAKTTVLHNFECRQAGTNSFIRYEECEGKFTIQIGIGGSNFNCRKKR